MSQKKKNKKLGNNGITNNERFNSIVDDMINKGYSKPEITDEVMSLTRGLSREQVYNRVKKRVYYLTKGDASGKSCQKNKIAKEKPMLKHSFEKKANGDTVLDCVIDLLDGENVVTEEQVLNAYNMKKTDWEVLSFRASAYPGYDEDGNIVARQACKLTVRPTKRYETQEIFDEAIDLVSFDKTPKIKYEPLRTSAKAKNSSNELEIAIADLHYGLRGSNRATGETYNCEIAAQRLRDTINQTIQEVSDLNINPRFVHLVTLGDFIHVDNGKQTTTNGTFQQLDGTIYEVTAGAIDLMIETIKTIRNAFEVPIKYTYIPGNHDREMGYMIAQATRCAFLEYGDIEFDVLENPNKIHKYGDQLVGFAHGDMKLKQLNNLLQTQFRDEYAKSDHPNHRIHVGHLHNLSGATESDVYVKHFPTLCGPSLWEHQQGFDSPKALCYTVYNTKTGNVLEGTVYPSV